MTHLDEQAAKEYADKESPMKDEDAYDSDFEFHMSMSAQLEIQKHFLAGVAYAEGKQIRLTREELEKIIGDAYESGWSALNLYTEKQQYISSILKQIES